MLHTFEPRYVLPDRKAINHHYMPEMYRQIKIKITEAMKQGLLYFPLTTNAWTSRASNSYVMHTVHYIDEKWNLCNNVLDTAEITTEHTAVNLSGELKESLVKWELNEEQTIQETLSMPLSSFTGSILAALHILCNWE